MNTFTEWLYRKRIVTKPIKSAADLCEAVTDRQELITGFSQRALSRAYGLMIGAGGLNSEIAEGMTRKGIGRMDFLDHDIVSPSNLSRTLHFARDIGRAKSKRLVCNLAAHATCQTELRGYALSFEDAVALGFEFAPDFVVCGVDDQKCRFAAARYFWQRNIPIIFCACDLLAECGHVFVQQPGGACFLCCFPQTGQQDIKVPCRTPASKDVLKVLAGLVLLSVDTLLMERKRSWNYRLIHLAGFAPDICEMVQQNPDCPLCSSSVPINTAHS